MIQTRVAEGGSWNATFSGWMLTGTITHMISLYFEHPKVLSNSQSLRSFLKKPTLNLLIPVN